MTLLGSVELSQTPKRVSPCAQLGLAAQIVALKMAVQTNRFRKCIDSTSPSSAALDNQVSILSPAGPTQLQAVGAAIHEMTGCIRYWQSRVTHLVRPDSNVSEREEPWPLGR